MLEKESQQMLEFFSKHLQLFHMVDYSSDEEIISLCENLSSEVVQKNFGYHNYWEFRSEWESFRGADRSAFEKLTECSLNTFLAFLVCFSRHEHLSGDYGTIYLAGVRNGEYEFILTQIVDRLKQEESDKNNRIGIAGEFFVAAELTRRGYVASLTSKNTKKIDLLASSKDGERSICIQIKTCSNKKMDKWKMSKSSEQGASKNLFYVLVNLREDETPKFFIVPSTVVAERIAEDYLKWKMTSGKDGSMHPDTDMRTFKGEDADKELYQDAWRLLGLD